MAQAEVPATQPEATETLVLRCKSFPDDFAAQVRHLLPGVTVMKTVARVPLNRPEGA